MVEIVIVQPAFYQRKKKIVSHNTAGIIRFFLLIISIWKFLKLREKDCDNMW